MKRRLTIGGGVIALFLLVAWWLVANSPDALSQRFVVALVNYEDGPVFEHLLARGADPNYLCKPHYQLKLKDKLIAFVAGAYSSTEYAPKAAPLLFCAWANGNEDAVNFSFR
jgi:hypothetical protein